MDAAGGAGREGEGLTTGWRYWQLAESGRLRSISQKRVEWPLDRPLRAFCVTGNHPSPTEGCNCGIYAAPDLETLRRHRLCLAPDALVVGEVELSGRLAMGEDGYRGESARPLSLSLVAETVPPGSADRVLEALVAYRVPVTTTALADVVGDIARAVMANQAMSARTR